MPILPQSTVDALLKRRRKARNLLDEKPRVRDYIHSKAEGVIDIVDLVLNDLQPEPERPKRRRRFKDYSDEEVQRLKKPPAFVTDAVNGGLKVDSVKMAVFTLILRRVRNGSLVVPTHVIEKEWPRDVEALWRPCTPGTVSRRFRELQEEGFITVIEQRSQSSEGHWKIERIYGWPVVALGEQKELF